VKWVGNVARWERRGAYKVLVWKFKGKEQLRNASLNGEDNIIINFKESFCSSVN